MGIKATSVFGIPAAMFCVFIMCSLARGFDKADLAKLQATGHCTDCDLSAARLIDAGGADLRGANLKSANMRRAKLKKTNLENANLEGANLSWADLQGADLTGANLDNANLEHATWTDGSQCERGSIGQCNK